jgi:hypothetical protein
MAGAESVVFTFYCWNLSQKSFRVKLDERDSQRLDDYLKKEGGGIEPVRSHNVRCSDNNLYTFYFKKLDEDYYEETGFPGCVNKLPDGKSYEFYFRNWGNRNTGVDEFKKLLDKWKKGKSQVLFLSRMWLTQAEKTVYFEADLQDPLEAKDAKNISDCTGRLRRPSENEIESSDSESEEESDDQLNDDTDPIQMKIDSLTAMIKDKPKKFEQVVSDIKSAFSERLSKEKEYKTFQVEPVDLNLVKKILAKITTPPIVRRTFGENMLFRKVYEVPPQDRSEFLIIRLLLNLLQFQARKEFQAREEFQARTEDLPRKQPRKRWKSLNSPILEDETEQKRKDDIHETEDELDEEISRAPAAPTMTRGIEGLSSKELDDLIDEELAIRS